MATITRGMNVAIAITNIAVMLRALWYGETVIFVVSFLLLTCACVVGGLAHEEVLRRRRVDDDTERLLRVVDAYRVGASSPFRSTEVRTERKRERA